MFIKLTRIVLLVLFLLHGFGCATVSINDNYAIKNNYVGILNSWLDKNLNYLLMNWGIPDNSLTPNEGGMIIEYIDKAIVTVDGMKYPTPAIQIEQESFWLSGELKTDGISIDYKKGIIADSNIAYICKVRFFIERNSTIKKWQIMSNGCLTL